MSETTSKIERRSTTESTSAQSVYDKGLFRFSSNDLDRALAMIQFLYLNGYNVNVVNNYQTGKLSCITYTKEYPNGEKDI